MPEQLPVYTGIKGRQVHPLIRFLLFVPGWRHGAVNGVPLSSGSPGHFSVWASNTLKMRSWMTHALIVGV